jgi:hypothetical protein
MDSASVVAGVHLTAGGVALPGTVVAISSGGTILRATFTPSAPLAPLTDYQLTVGAGVRDRDGEALAAAVVSAFTTGGDGPDEAAPQVTVLSPTPGEAMPLRFASLTVSMVFDDEVGGLTLELRDEASGEVPLRLFLPPGLPAGTHTVRLTATDLAGNPGSSPSFDLTLAEPVPGPDPELEVRAFAVLELEEAGGRWSYSPQLTVAAGSAGTGIEVLGFEMLEIPGLAPPLPALYANGVSVAAGSQAELFREFYGDYPISFSGWEPRRATGGDVNARLTYRDGTGTIRQVTLVAPIVPGGPPGSYTGGTCVHWVFGFVMRACTP